MSLDKQPTWNAATLVCGEEGFFGSPERNDLLQRRLGLSGQQYRLACRVLYPAKLWTKKEAWRQAFKLVEDPAAWRAIVLLGGKTKTAFGYDRPFFSHNVSSLNADVQLVALPSPADRAWCDARLVYRARQLLRDVIPSLPWGTHYDRFTTLGFSLRGGAECTLWALALPTALREAAAWTEDEFMGALDAAEQHGLDRTRGEYLARVGGKVAA